MNTKKQNQKSQRLRKQQKQTQKKQGQMLHENRKIHEHEFPELRMTD